MLAKVLNTEFAMGSAQPHLRFVKPNILLSQRIHCLVPSLFGRKHETRRIVVSALQVRNFRRAKQRLIKFFGNSTRLLEINSDAAIPHRGDCSSRGTAMGNASF